MARSAERRPVDLLDTDLPDYSVEAAKGAYRTRDRDRRRAMRAESVRDEDGEEFEKAYDQGIMLRLLGYLKPYRLQLSLGVGLLLLSSALTPSSPPCWRARSTTTSSRRPSRSPASTWTGVCAASQ